MVRREQCLPRLDLQPKTIFMLDKTIEYASCCSRTRETLEQRPTWSEKDCPSLILPAKSKMTKGAHAPHPEACSVSAGKGISVGGVKGCLRVLVQWVGAVWVFLFLLLLLFVFLRVGVCSTEVESPTLEPDFLGFETG